MSRKRTQVVYVTPEEKNVIENAVDALFDGKGDSVPTGLGTAEIAERFLQQVE